MSITISGKQIAARVIKCDAELCQSDINPGDPYHFAYLETTVKQEDPIILCGTCGYDLTYNPGICDTCGEESTHINHGLCLDCLGKYGD